jgi:hypothetical protein
MEMKSAAFSFYSLWRSFDPRNATLISTGSFQAWQAQ